MTILPFSEQALAEAISILRKGGVIAHATETCYGLACDLTNPSAVEKLFAIKNRPHTQPVSGLFSSVDDAKRFVEWNQKAEELVMHLPGPLTLILPMRADAPMHLYPVLDAVETPRRGVSTGTIGVRISSYSHAQALVHAFGKPISTTSANLHGQPNPYSAADIAAQFADASHVPDLILDSGQLPPVPPSTVVDCTGETIHTKREGGLNV